MAFLEALPELLEGAQAIEGSALPLFQSIYSGALQNQTLENSNYQQLQNFGQQRALQNASLQQGITLQQNAFTHQTQMQSSQFQNNLSMQSDENQFRANLADATFTHQNEMQQNQFQNQSQLESARFTQQNNLQTSAFKQNLATNAIGAGVNLGGSLIESGINYALSSQLLNQQASLQRQNFDYTTGKAASAFESAGLPSWLAYGGPSGALPHQTQQISGQNTYTSVLPGNSNALIWNGSSSQLALGVGNVPSAQ